MNNRKSLFITYRLVAMMNRRFFITETVFGIVLAVLVLGVSMILLVPGPYRPAETVHSREIVPSPIYFFTVWMRGNEKVTGLSNVKPSWEKVNVTEVGNSEPLLIERNLIDRAYDEETEISVLLSMNSKEAPGKVVHLEMLFDYDNDGSTDTTVFFDTFETEEIFRVENFSFRPMGRNGSFRDFRGMDDTDDGRAPGGTVTIKIWRTDQQDDSDLLIYCGAYNRSSYASVPYFEVPGGDDDGSDNLLVTLLVVFVGVLVAVYLVLKLSARKYDPKRVRERGDDRRRKKRKNKMRRGGSR